MRRATGAVLFACLLAAGGGHWLARCMATTARAGDFSAQFDHPDTQVILYTANACASCPGVAARLRSQGARFVERNLDTTPGHFKRFQEMSGQYIPSLVLRDRVYEGEIPESVPLP